MESDPICPSCHVAVKDTDFFCYNCGKNLHPKPISTSITNQLLIYTGSILLPPLGIYWGVRYLRQPDTTSKIAGYLAIVLTVISFFITVKITIDYINTFNTQFNSQLQNLQGY